MEHNYSVKSFLLYWKKVFVILKQSTDLTFTEKYLTVCQSYPLMHEGSAVCCQIPLVNRLWFNIFFPVYTRFSLGPPAVLQKSSLALSDSHTAAGEASEPPDDDKLLLKLGLLQQSHR